VEEVEEAVEEVEEAVEEMDMPLPPVHLVVDSL
jgi:hypothetical protein